MNLRLGPRERALKDMGVDYELAPGPGRPSKRNEMIEHGPKALPGDRVQDGTWYDEESRDTEKAIRNGELMERARGAPEA